MALATGSVRKNGKMLLEDVRLWINSREDASGNQTYWGYMNPAWEAPIGRLDPDGEAEPRYELDLGEAGVVSIRVQDHREEAFVQVNQNGYRTLRFESAR
ncbi:hypothetical protein [Thiohalorhabdus methylotrophus]|uniref:Uncharacterized protein n=1 Tax=Thiohalorhabdus methylotrophus TaxID=3242694 RepID=A0ABV4TTA5_9GAMM